MSRITTYSFIPEMTILRCLQDENENNRLNAKNSSIDRQTVD